ncbi:hypothetical protein BH11VER1_BH11VER1_22570 [soil metagenome]
MKLNWLRHPPPLRVSIPLLVLVFNLCFLCVTAYLIHLRDQERETDRALSNTRLLASRLATVVHRYDQSQGAPSKEESDIASKDYWVQWSVICTADGIVTYSSKSELIGKPLTSFAHAKVADSLATAFQSKNAQSFILNQDSTVALHPGPAAVGGAIPWVAIVERKLTGVLKVETDNTISDTLFAAVLLLIFSLGLWWGLHWFLTRRLGQLLQSVSLITKDASKHEPLSGNDEFAHISRALWESESRFHQIAENIKEALYIAAVDQPKVFYVSPAYEQIWGLKIADLLKNPFSWVTTVLEEDRHLIISLHEKLSDGRLLTRCEYRIQHPINGIRWLETVAFPVRNEKNEIYRIVGQTTDITARKELEEEIINISERERRRIGYDLHDDLGQRLAAIKLRCEFFVHMLESKEPPSVEHARDICGQIGEATILCRDIARGLSPVDLEEDGLMLSLDKLIPQLESRYEIPIFFRCPSPVLVENEITASHLYRIAQEFINNAARHGKTNHIYVHLTADDRYVRLEVLNDGVPFQKDVASNNGMGLKFAHYRASTMGATIEINPRSDGVSGTQAVCLTPNSACKRKATPPQRPNHR